MFGVTPEGTAMRSIAVLVVDNDPLILLYLTRGLEIEGFSVFPADSGRKAIEVLRANQTAITVALIDLKMPDLDGIATLEHLLHVKPNLQCCLLTGSLDAERLRHVAGVACVLTKPFPLP